MIEMSRWSSGRPHRWTVPAAPRGTAISPSKAMIRLTAHMKSIRLDGNKEEKSSDDVNILDCQPYFLSTGTERGTMIQHLSQLADLGGQDTRPKPKPKSSSFTSDNGSARGQVQQSACRTPSSTGLCTNDCGGWTS